MEATTYVSVPHSTFQKMESDLEEIKELILLKVKSPNKEYLSIDETCNILNYGKTKIHALINDGRLERVKRDRRTYITKRSVDLFLKTPTK